MLLPREHRLTTLIVNDCHNKMQQVGIGTTLNHLRERGYWIPKDSMAVKKALSSRNMCKRYNALEFKYLRFTNMLKHL